MNMDVIAACKTNYKGLMLQNIIKVLGRRQSRFEDFESFERGMRGLAKGCDPHMLDVTEMSFKSWAMITGSTIAQF